MLLPGEKGGPEGLAPLLPPRFLKFPLPFSGNSVIVSVLS